MNDLILVGLIFILFVALVLCIVRGGDRDGIDQEEVDKQEKLDKEREDK